MSIPVNHHHVSRCQSDNFLDTLKGKIFVLNKENHTIKFKTSTKRLFSEDHSNTKISDNNEVDSESLEMDLRVNYEDHFNKNVKTLKK